MPHCAVLGHQICDGQREQPQGLTRVRCEPIEVKHGPMTPQSTVLNQGTANAEAPLPHQERGVAAAMLPCGGPQGVSQGARSHGSHMLAHGRTVGRASGSW